MAMQSNEMSLYCDEDMPCVLSPKGTEDNVVVELDTMFLDNDMPDCTDEFSDLKNAVQAVHDRRRVLRWMFEHSICIQLHRTPLLPSIVTLRMACVRKMEQILHFSQINGETVVREATVIQAVMFLDWVIEHELKWFMKMKPEVLGGVCIILSVENATQPDMQVLFRLVTFTSYMTESEIEIIVSEVNDMRTQVGQRYTRLVFTDFIGQYFAHDKCTMERLVHYFYKFITQKCDTWLLNIYKSFVEITLEESTDMDVHVEILDDYVNICE